MNSHDKHTSRNNNIIIYKPYNGHAHGPRSLKFHYTADPTSNIDTVTTDGVILYSSSFGFLHSLSLRPSP